MAYFYEHSTQVLGKVLPKKLKEIHRTLGKNEREKILRKIETTLSKQYFSTQLKHHTRKQFIMFLFVLKTSFIFNQIVYTIKRGVHGECEVIK